MQRVFSSPNLMAVTELKRLLETEGIPCFVKNEILAGLSPEVPWTETFPELWVQNDSDLSRARSIKEDWKKPPTESLGQWTCPTCHEELEGQFTSCWNCGTKKP
jgi:hypothetical protein